MDVAFHPASYQEIYIQTLKKRIEEFESGEAYQKLQHVVEEQQNTIEKMSKDIERLSREVAKTVRTWMQVNEDVVKEKEEALAAKDKELEKMQEKVWKAEKERDDAKDALQKEREEKYKVMGQLQDLNDKFNGLMAKYKKDSTNSSKPSSTDPNHAPIPNNREKTDRHVGGQPGHTGHKRPEYKPARVIDIPPPDYLLDTSKYKPTGEIIKKQLVSARLVIDVTEFRTREFRNIETGQRVHAPFPVGLVNELTYDGSVKAMAYIMNNYCNVSIDRTAEFLRDASDGELHLSKGFISNLTHQFSVLTEQEREEAFRNLATAPVLHIDFSFGRCGGKTSTVAITCTEGDEPAIMFQARDRKGKEGVKDTPGELNPNTVVSDHESSLIHLGSRHQECLAHGSRYAKGSMDNEPKLKWNKMMHDTLNDIIRYREGMKPGEELDPEKCSEYKKRFYEALAQGKKDYTDYPPTAYYRVGYYLWKRMNETPEDYLLTLEDVTVPPTNNSCERGARKYKRKIKSVMGFRSKNGHSDFCDGLTIVETMRMRGKNLFKGVKKIFNRFLDGDTSSEAAPT